MRIRVRIFAILREKLRREQMELTLAEGATVGDLWGVLCREHPLLEAMGGSVSFAVNQEYVECSHVLNDGDEVALIPPVSGG